MRSVLRTAAVPALLLFSQLLWADQITLKNGDRLSGTIEKSDAKTLVIKTEYAGEVTVQLPAITEVNSAKPLRVALKSGQTVTGPVTTSDGNFDVQPAGKAEVTIARTEVVSMEEEGAYEQSRHPGWSHGWTGGANVSFAVTRGNSETKNLALAFTADHKSLDDHIGLYANSVFASDDAPGAVPSTTAQQTQGGARYDRDVAKRVFGFGAGDFQTDALQDLNLRSVFSAGAGFHAIKTDRTTLDFLAGGNYTRESYSTLQRNVAAITLGQELTTKLGASTVLAEKLYGYPDLNYAGQYRATFNFGTVTKLSKWLGWQNAFSDIYVTNPPIGTKQNDILLTTGLNVSFKR